jgi:hypothetical protein
MAESHPVATQAATQVATPTPFAGLVDALDAVIDNGAVVAGDVVIALDGIDLIRLDLRLLLTGVDSEEAS